MTTIKKRKIVQIATGTAGEGSQRWAIPFALCDDGTVWQLIRYDWDRPDEWKRLPAIPQMEGRQ